MPDDFEVIDSTALQSRGEIASGGTFELRVVAGPDRDRTLTVDGATPTRALVGQSPACALRLTDREVSRRHLAIEVVGAALRVTDIGSTNGTRVNGVRVRDFDLVGGEAIELGRTTLRVERKEATPSRIPTEARFGRLVGASAAIRKLHPLWYRLADEEEPVVIEGETGTGKELLAETLHEVGPRKHGPFIVVDCGGTPQSSLEGALFAEDGAFAQANGGTLLLDEIAELGLPLQSRLLHALDRKEIWRDGATRGVPIDVRLIATTRLDIDAHVQSGRFRDDLYFRLAVGRTEMPPLRNRAGDVALLFAHFLGALGGKGSPDELASRFASYGWPGNVRELRNVVVREIAMSAGDAHDASDVGSAAGGVPSAGDERDVIARVLEEDLALPSAREKVVDAFERRYVERVLEQHGGNVARAAAASGLALRYFQKIRARQR
jgi:DNA-binding NtrC family response regulator